MMLTGTDKDPNTCQYCNESFSRANELVIHYQEKHPEIFREINNSIIEINIKEEKRN